MKKTTLLTLTLLLGGSVTGSLCAQTTTTAEKVTSLDEVTDGWYQLKNTATSRSSSGILNQFVGNAETVHFVDGTGSGAGGYALIDMTEDEVQAARAQSFVHITKTGNNFNFQSTNGQYINSKAISSSTPVNVALELDASAGSFKIGDFWDGWENGRIGGFSGSGAARFELYPVTMGGNYKTYTVDLSGLSYAYGNITQNVQLQYTGEGAEGLTKVYNGGTFFFPITDGTSVTPVAANFSLTSTVEALANFLATVTPTIEINEDAGTISVSYAPTDEAFQNIITEAEAALAKDGVGYPVQAQRDALGAAVNTAKNVTSPTLLDEYNISPVLTTYMTTDNVKMPEDGKAYTFTLVLKNGNKRLMWFNTSADTYHMTGAGEEPTETQKAQARLICRVVNGQYVFVNNDGKYMVWRGNKNGYNGNKGYNNTYDEGVCRFTIAKLTPSLNGNVQQDNDKDLFGYVYVTGKRNDKSTNGCFIGRVDTYDITMTPYYTNELSSAILIEEVKYPNRVTLNAADGINDEDVATIGTFSAPFRTIVPEGVTAYYVSAAENGEATTKSIAEGEAIPAGTGVLLTAADEATTQAVMVPAAGETDATIENNLLSASAGAAKEIPAEENAYILTKSGEKVAFYLCSSTNRTLAMNKSYLVMPTTAGANVLNLKFGGEATGIGGIETDTTPADAPIYDLAGRRVQKATKGIYIIGGKKVLVK